MNLPIGSENEFEGLVDLVTMKEWIWDSDDLGASWKLVEIRDSLKTQADKMRSELIELAVEQDDEWMEKYLEGEEPDTDSLRELIRKGTLNMSFVPVLCGSAFKNKGVQTMLNSVIDFLPGPLDVPPYMGFAPNDPEEKRNIERKADDNDPFSGLAFKLSLIHI